MTAADALSHVSTMAARSLQAAASQMHARGFVHEPLPLDYFAAHLPDYDVAQLRHWMSLYFHKPTSVGYYVQCIVCTVLLGIILSFGLGVILYRLWDRTLWLFRIQETRGSSLIIPNSITAFVLFEAAYACVWLSDVWNNLAIDKWGADPLLTGFWNGTPWILLFVGAWCGAWGTFFASPGILHRTSRRGFDPRRLIPGPKMCNFIGVIAPFSFTAASLSVSIPTGLTYKSAVEQWRAWDASAAMVAQDEYPVTGILREEAAEVYKQICDAWWWSSVGWLALLVFAWLFLIFYWSCGGFLVYSIHRQLQTLRAPREDNRRNGPGQEGSWPGNDASGPEAPRWDRANAIDFAANLEMSRAQASTFFPPLATQGTVTTGPTTRKSRIRMLSSAMINVTFIYTSISLGCLGFVINLHWLLAEQYQAAIMGPVETNRIYEKYMAVASWIASVFGGICFTAISQKTFEGVFEEWSAQREAKKAKVSRNTDSSATLTERKAIKTPSTMSLRLKSLKSATASNTPVTSHAVSRTGSVNNREGQPPSADPNMDPAHTRALQYFHRHGGVVLDAVAADGEHADGNSPGDTEAFEHGSLSRKASLRQVCTPPPVSSGGLPLHRTFSKPFDHYRLSTEHLDDPVEGEDPSDRMPFPRTELLPIPAAAGSLTPRRYGSAASGIIVQRAITCTSEEVRSGQGNEVSGSAASARPRSILKNDGSFSRPAIWREKLSALQNDVLPASSAMRAGTTTRDRRRHFLQDDSIANTDADIEYDLAADRDDVSNCTESQSETGSIHHPSRPSRPASSVLAVSHTNANVSPTFGTSELWPNSNSAPPTDGEFATPRIPQGHGSAFGAESSQLTLAVDPSSAALGFDRTVRRPSLRWQESIDANEDRAKEFISDSSRPRRARLSSLGRDDSSAYR